MDSAICLRFGHPTTLRPTKPQYPFPISKISPHRHFLRFSSKPSPKESLVSGNFVGVFDMRKMFLKDKVNPFKIRSSQQDSEPVGPGDGGDFDAPRVNGKKYLRPIFKKWIDYLASPARARDESALFPPNFPMQQLKNDTDRILNLIKDEGTNEQTTRKIKDICEKYGTCHGDEVKYLAEISFTESLISKGKYKEALKLSWLDGKPPNPSDVSRPLLYKAIIYSMSKDENDVDKAKKCWMDFANEGLEGPDNPNDD